MNVVRYAANTQGRDFIVGDIHGNFDMLRALLKQVNFDNTKDRIFSLGDLVDRGPSSAEAFYWLEMPWFKAVRGNHEQICIDAVRNNGNQVVHLLNGGDWFYYDNNDGNLRDAGLTQEQFADAFEKLPLAIELMRTDGKMLGLIHAEPNGVQWGGVVDRLNANDEDTVHAAMWGRDRVRQKNSISINDVLYVLVGHTVVREPAELGNVRYLDTGACFGGCLTMMDANTEDLYVLCPEGGSRI